MIGKDYDLFVFQSIVIHTTGDLTNLTAAAPNLKYANYKHVDVCFIDQNQQNAYAMGSATANGDSWIVYAQSTADSYFTIRVYAYKN